MRGKRTAFPGVLRLAPNRYRVRGEYTCQKTGKRREFDRVVTAESTEGAARERAAIKREILSAHGRAARPHLAAYAESWLRGKLPTLKASTRSHYATMLDLHILPALGDYYIDALTRDDIEKWRDAQKGAPASINGRLRVLRTLLSDATTDIGLSVSPADRVRQVRQVHSEDNGKVMTPAQLRAVVLHVREHEARWYPLILALATTGGRFGAISALRWDDVNYDELTIRVRRAHWRGVVDTTKTGTVRTLPVAPELLRVLREHRKDLLRRQGGRWAEGWARGLAAGWVFPTHTGGLSTPSSVTKPLKRAAQSQAARGAGLEGNPTAHWFRHTMNDLLRRATTGQVQRSITGHVTEVMSEHYSHVDISEKRAALSGVLAGVLELDPGFHPGCEAEKKETTE